MRNGKSILIAVVIIFFIIPFRLAAPRAEAAGRAGSITGAVKDENGKPLSYANIILEGLDIGTMSMKDGSFSLSNLKPGRYRLSVSYVGYRGQSRLVDIGPGSEVSVEFILEESLFELEPVVVTGSPIASDPLKSPLDISYIGGREKLRLQAASLGKTIENIPGVTNMSTGGAAGKPVIRGHTGERIRILMDGVSQEYQQYGERHAPNIDPFNFERVEVIKGASSLLYGSDAIGGAVNLIPLKVQFGPAEGSHWGGRLMSRWNSVNRERSAGLRLKGGTGKFGFHGSFSARKAGNLSTPEEPTFSESGIPGDPRFTGEIDHTDYVQYTGAVSGGYMFDDATLNLSYNYWRNGNNYILPTGGPIGLGLSNQIASAKGFLQAGGLIIKPKFSYQRNRRRATAPGLSREYIPDSARVDLELDVYTMRIDMEHRNTGRFSGTVGAEIKYYRHENLGLVPLQPTGHYTNSSLYVFEEIDLGNYNLNTGLRFDYRNQKFFSSESNPLLPADQENDYFNLASSLGASRSLGENLTLVANINQGFRIPSFFNSYVYGLHGGVFAFQIGNPDLEPELSIDVSSGLRLSAPYVDASVTGYFDYIRNYIYLYDAPGHPLAPPPAEYEFVFAHDQDQARIMGLDIHAGIKPLEWLQFDGNLSVITSEFLTGPHRGKGLPLMPAAKAYGMVRFIMSDAGRLRNSNIHLKLRYSSDKEAAGIYEPFGQFDDGIGPDIPFGVASTKSYMLLDAGAGFDLDFAETAIKVDIEATNLTDEPYRDFLDTYKGYLLGPGRGFSVTVNLPFWYR